MISANWLILLMLQFVLRKWWNNWDCCWGYGELELLILQDPFLRIGSRIQIAKHCTLLVTEGKCPKQFTHLFGYISVFVEFTQIPTWKLPSKKWGIKRSASLLAIRICHHIKYSKKNKLFRFYTSLFLWYPKIGK